MSYWNTSTLAKLYTQESDSYDFEARAASQTTPIISSRVAIYEARATFWRKEAERILAVGTAEITYNELLHDIGANDVRLVELDAAVELEYGRVLSHCFQQMPLLSLRTLDAIHLASARVAGETEIVATDNRLRKAAKLLGFSLFPS